MSDAVVPFRLDVPEADLVDLRERLARTRWPEPATVDERPADDDWSQGPPLGYLRELCRYWAQRYDWRVVEARLNTLPQFRTVLDGDGAEPLGVHFLHARSRHADALPLVLTHGWTGSVVEFLDVVALLTDPPDPRDAFHVVVPSLPGYGFSDRPTRRGWTVERIATAWAQLMARLGHDRYGAAGSDWGTTVSTLLGVQDAPHVAGIHVVPPLAPPDPATFDNATPAERAALAALRSGYDGDGYTHQQATRPQTIGYGLVDSPALLCAWIIEKFAAWTDSGGRPESVLGRDALLDNLMLYWLPSTGASAARLYRESIRGVQGVLFGTDTTALQVVDVPTGCSSFPAEGLRPSRRWAQRRYRDIRYWGEPARGGHFPAFEQPELFVDELRAFFRLVR